MTEQADLKARVEELADALREKSHDPLSLKWHDPNGSYGTKPRALLDAAADRITDLEAERDGYCNGVGQVRHELKAAESRLALAEKVVEAGRVFQRYIAAWDAKPMSGMDDTIHGIHVGTEWQAEIRRSDLRALTSALTAFAENTSSNDLTTGEDDA